MSVKSNYQLDMKVAYAASLFSPDPSTQNGAVLLNRDGEVISIGANIFPSGVDGRHWTGPKEGKYARVVHAEASTIINAAFKGISTEGSTLVCPWAACANCAKHMALAGVVRLVRHAWEDQTTSDSWKADCEIGDDIMLEAGIEIIEIPPVPHDIEIRRNGEMWTP